MPEDALSSKKPSKRARNTNVERVFVKSDKSGQILAVLKVETLPDDRESPFDDNDPDIDVIEIKPALVKSTFGRMEVVDIHLGYVVDVKTGTLKKKNA
jgi:hypothetical protein